MLKMKHYLRHENKVNENKVFSFCEALRYMSTNDKRQKMLSFMSNLQTYHHLNLISEK